MKIEKIFGNSSHLWHEGADGVEAVAAVEPPDLAAVLAVVVHEHVLAEAEQAGGVHVERGRHRDLEPPHVPRVAGIFKAILIALEEELQLEPEQQNMSFSKL